MIGFFFGVYMGGVIVWIWAMCREADEDEAIRQQFDDGLSQAMRPLNRFPDPSDPEQSTIRDIKELTRYGPIIPKLHQSTADEVVQAINRVRRKLRRHEAVDGARAREGLSPLLFQRRPLPPPPPPPDGPITFEQLFGDDDEPETFI